jgi:hypothetical protein
MGILEGVYMATIPLSINAFLFRLTFPSSLLNSDPYLNFRLTHYRSR